MWWNFYANRRVFRALIYLFDDAFFLFYSASWFLIRFTRIGGLPIPILNNWLTDFVFVPLIVHATQAISFLCLPNTKPYRFPLYQILLIALLTSIVFECIMPMMTNHHTADFWDIVVYFASAFFYFYVHQPYSLKRYGFNNCV